MLAQAIPLKRRLKAELRPGSFERSHEPARLQHLVALSAKVIRKSILQGFATVHGYSRIDLFECNEAFVVGADLDTLRGISDPQARWFRKIDGAELRSRSQPLECWAALDSLAPVRRDRLRGPPGADPCRNNSTAVSANSCGPIPPLGSYQV